MIAERAAHFGLEITEDDILYVTAAMTTCAETYLHNLERERTRLTTSKARARLRNVSRLATELVEALVSLDSPDRAAASRKKRSPTTSEPHSWNHVQHLLAASIMARRGDPKARSLIVPSSRATDLLEFLEADFAVSKKMVVNRILDVLVELDEAAHEAAELPLGKEDFPAWPMLTRPKVSLRAVERASDEIAVMFGMLLGRIPSGSRQRAEPNSGPLISPLRLFFEWVKQLSGEQPPAAMTLEKALHRVRKIPTSLVGSLWKRHYDSTGRPTKS